MSLKRSRSRSAPTAHKALTLKALALGGGPLVALVLLVMGGIWGWTGPSPSGPQPKPPTSTPRPPSRPSTPASVDEGHRARWTEVVRDVALPAAYKALASCSAWAGCSRPDEQDRRGRETVRSRPPRPRRARGLAGDAACLKSAFALLDTAPYARICEALLDAAHRRRPPSIAPRRGEAPWPSPS